MGYWLVGGKYDYLSRKNANISGNRWKKGRKEEIFTVLEKKKKIEKGVGQKYQLLG